MVRGFVHDRLPGRVVFGVGSVEHVPDEVEALGCQRVLVIAGGSSGAAGQRVANTLGRLAAARFDKVAQHVPEVLADEARRVAADAGVDGLCSVGGGSATGLAKAVAVELDLPVLAVPTTYAGSEATPIYGVTGARKRTGRDRRALPRTVVYDPALSTALPPRATAASGLNALAHAAAALGAPTDDPIASLDAEEAVRRLTAGLPTAVRHPEDVGARADLLLGAYHAASGLAATGAGLHHRLCHVLGGRYGLVHAEVHALLLPHTLARDEALSAAGLRRLRAAMGVGDPAGGTQALLHDLGLPAGLAAIGMPGDELDDVAEEAARAIDSAHPRAGDAAWFRALLEEAHAGWPVRRDGAGASGAHPRDPGGHPRDPEDETR